MTPLTQSLITMVSSSKIIYTVYCFFSEVSEVSEVSGPTRYPVWGSPKLKTWFWDSSIKIPKSAEGDPQRFFVLGIKNLLQKPRYGVDPKRKKTIMSELPMQQQMQQSTSRLPITDGFLKLPMSTGRPTPLRIRSVRMTISGIFAKCPHSKIVRACDGLK